MTNARTGGGFASALPSTAHAGPPPGLGPFLKEVAEVLDAAGVLTDPAERERYATPWRGPTGRTPAVLRPRSTEDVAAIVRLAVAHGVRLIPQGANTGLVEASVPDPFGAMVVLSLGRLNRRLDIDPADRTVVASAGVLLSTLNEALACHGLTMPIDVGSDPSVGGMVSTNTGGARMAHHGDVRRRVLGLEVVLAEPPGEVLDGLAALRKDNTSPRVSDWFIGAGGRFGVVTAAALEVVPMDHHAVTAFVVPTDDQAAVDLTVALEQRLGGRLRAVEALGSEALALAVAQDGVRSPFAGNDAGSDTEWPHLTLLIESATADATEASDLEVALVDALAALPTGLVTTAVIVPAADAWALRHGLSASLARAGTVVGFDLSVRRSRLPALRQALDQQIRPSLPPDAILVEFGHWGDGSLHANVVFGDGRPHAQTEAGLRRRMWELVTNLGGSWASEHGWGPANDQALAEHGDPARTNLLARMKAMLDPYDVLGRPRS
ncbi:MAG: FAD-binding oxidoreductase [Microthrixaceae bacterium]